MQTFYSFTVKDRKIVAERKKMVRECYEKIVSGEEVRKNLIDLRAFLADEQNKRALAHVLGGNFDVLCGLLEDEDPKIRKNAALILGEMETEDMLPFLFAAYNKEQTLFVREDYLTAMQKLDCRSYLPQLRARLDELDQMEFTEENRKHLRAEQVALRSLVSKYEKPRKHKYVPVNPAPDLIVVTNREQREVTGSQIHSGECKLLGIGYRVHAGNLEEILKIRTWSELLFPIPGNHEVLPVDESPYVLGERLAHMDIPSFLDGFHTGGSCYMYRLDVRGKSLEKKGVFLRRLSEAFERASDGRLQNSVDNYEFELRLVERKDGTYLPLLRLFTLPEYRFAYRREVIPDSISPVNAALAVQIALPYLKEYAQVLDPFCGVGTMLIERQIALPARSLYGTDIYGEAIEKAKTNSKRIGFTVNYIHRNFFDFTHEYLFDEVITDMPRASQESEDETLYRRFFTTVKPLLSAGAVLVLYTMRPRLVSEIVSMDGDYTILEDRLLNEKNQTKVFVLRYGTQTGC